MSVTQEGDMYKGDWKNNKPDGVGRFVRYNGDYYQGEFSNGMPHGKGMSKEGGSGITYEGTWDYGVKNGPGIEKCPDGSNYKGKQHLKFLNIHY